MFQSRDALKEKYKLVIKNRESDQKRDELRRSCFQFLKKAPAPLCFKLLPFSDILKEFLERAAKNSHPEFRHLVKVLQLFEKYAESILAKPWCKDIYTIKVYTGFFKYNFEKWISLDATYKVFNLIGYTKKSDDTLILEGPADEDRALAMGFELYLAHTQLYIFESTKFLSSKYAMRDIMEGWFNTIGNPFDVLEWLEQNNSAKGAAPGLEDRYRSSTEVPDETRFQSVTLVSHRDKNGDSVNYPVKYPPGKIVPYGIDEHYRSSTDSNTFDNSSYDKDNLVKYPPGGKGDELYESLHFQGLNQAWQNQRDKSSPADGNCSSMLTVDISDSELYGDQATPSPQNSNTTSDYLNSKALPYSSHDDGNYENLRVYQSSNATCRTKHPTQAYPTTDKSLNSDSGKETRSENDENMPIYGNTTMEKYFTTHENLKTDDMLLAFYAQDDSSDKNMLEQEKERVHKIMKNRIQTGEKMLQRNPVVNKNYAHGIHDGDYDGTVTTRDDLMYDATITTRDDLQPRIDKLIDDKTPNQSVFSNNFSDVRNYTVGYKLYADSCTNCVESPAFGCSKCKGVACKGCYMMFKETKCLEENAEHAILQITRV